MTIYPSTYSFFGRGGCLGGLVPDGSMLCADPLAPISPGDLVTIVMRPAAIHDAYFTYGHAHGVSGIVKVYLGRSLLPDGEPVHLLGLVSPPATLSIPESRIDAMHKVSGVLALDDEQPDEVRAATDFSLSLIMPFVKASDPLEPINRGWRPASDNAFFSMGSVLESAAGPTIGAAADLIELFIASREVATGKLTGEDAKVPLDDFLRFLMSNNPAYPVNLFYVRPALDYLFLNSMREAASPGYLKRKGKRRLKDYGQTNPLEKNSLRPFG